MAILCSRELDRRAGRPISENRETNADAKKRASQSCWQALQRTRLSMQIILPEPPKSEDSCCLTASVSGSPKAEKQYSSAQKFWTTISYYAESAPRYVGRTACYRDCVFIIVLESYSRHLLLKEDSGYLQSIESERRRQGAQNHRAGRVHPPRRRARPPRTKSSKGVFP